jgi:hypothetical protein
MGTWLRGFDGPAGASPTQTFPPLDVVVALNALGRRAIHHTHDAAALTRPSHQDLRGIGRRTDDAADLGHHFERVQDVDGIESLAQEQDEGMSGAYGQGVLLGQLDHRLVSPGPADQARTRGLTERQTELDTRHMGDHRLVDVLHAFDKVRLPEDKVDRLRFFDWHRYQFHGTSLPAGIRIPEDSIIVLPFRETERRRPPRAVTSQLRADRACGDRLACCLN